MASNCSQCGKVLPRFSFSKLCSECKEKNEARKTEEKQVENIFKEQRPIIEASIISSKSVSDQQLEIFKKISKKNVIELYEKLHEAFIKDAELEEREIEVLQKIQNAANLSNNDISYVEKILPYIYVASIRKEGKLPVPDIQYIDDQRPIFKKDELIHFASSTQLVELKTVRSTYQGGSRGVSFRVMKGFTYRIGAHRGHIVKDERLVPTSKGTLILTNQRLFLHPVPGFKPTNIPLNKILSYNCYQNNLEVYKEGREKGYIYSMNSGAVEIFGLCLGFLLNR